MTDAEAKARKEFEEWALEFGVTAERRGIAETAWQAGWQAGQASRREEVPQATVPEEVASLSNYLHEVATRISVYGRDTDFKAVIKAASMLEALAAENAFLRSENDAKAAKP